MQEARLAWTTNVLLAFLKVFAGRNLLNNLSL